MSKATKFATVSDELWDTGAIVEENLASSVIGEKLIELTFLDSPL